MSAFLELDDLTRRFAGGAGVEGVTVSLGHGEVLALLGPSGSGKTTTLRLLAGFESPDRGRILVGGEDVTRVPPERRRFGMVFQHYALFPHLSVGGNVGFGLDAAARAERATVDSRVSAALAAVDLAGFETRSIESLSGGQQQRVAVARAIAPEPRVLLLDEPLSNLDPGLRERTRRELRQLIERIGITTVLVTHEQDEAFDLADRIAVLEGGRLLQVGPARELYDRPRTPFVAQFIGRSTVVKGRIRNGRLELDPGLPAIDAMPDTPDGPVEVAIRPEAFRLGAPRPDGLRGRILDARFAGATSFYRVALDAGPTVIEVVGDPGRAPGEIVGLEPTGRGIARFGEPAA